MIVRSMTGYSNLTKTNENYDIEIELKSLNSRFFEFELKSNYFLDELENDLKNIIFNKLKRGKIKLYIKIFEKNAKNFDIIINYELAKKYEQALSQLSKEINIIPEINLKDFLSLGEILLIKRNENFEELYSIIKEMLNELLENILKMMIIEGQKTYEDIIKSINTISNKLEAIEILYPKSLIKYKEQLKEKIKELIPENLLNIIDNRLLLEVELIASKSAINEEIVRLKSHIKQFINIINNNEEGDSKKLDFIAQEMHREANTIAAKSIDYQIIQNTIDIKVEIEKIREQLRNLE